jgi:hypothetical protein
MMEAPAIRFEVAWKAAAKNHIRRLVTLTYIKALGTLSVVDPLLNILRQINAAPGRLWLISRSQPALTGTARPHGRVVRVLTWELHRSAIARGCNANARRAELML